MRKQIIRLIMVLCATAIGTVIASPFVQIKSGSFERNNSSYYFMGTNFWQGMNLGAPGLGRRNQLVIELDRMKNLGIKQLRILALSEGPDSAPYRIIPAVQNTPGIMNEDLLKGLDFLLVEMKKRDMTAVVCLANFWPWSGGFAQWVSWADASTIPYPPPHPGGDWGTFQDYSARFYSLPQAVKGQQESVKKIITRINSLSKIPYNEDPTIMAWELANEPRGGKNRKDFLAWISSSAKLIKSLDKNHLVTIGSEGETLNPRDAGNNFVEDHAIAEIDYATIHIWVENWGVYDPKKSNISLPMAVDTMRNYIEDHVKKSKTFKKPVVIEEFGIARDQRSMDPKSSTADRDHYYQAVFNETFRFMNMKGLVPGVNFWAWSGDARPSKPYGSLWKKSDDLLGDPPHEEQGWYGVYGSDTSTLNLIKNYAKKFEIQAKRK